MCSCVHAMVEPLPRPPSLAEVIGTLEDLDESFPEIDDPPVTPEQPL